MLETETIQLGKSAFYVLHELAEESRTTRLSTRP